MHVLEYLGKILCLMKMEMFIDGCMYSDTRSKFWFCAWFMIFVRLPRACIHVDGSVFSVDDRIEGVNRGICH